MPRVRLPFRLLFRHPGRFLGLLGDGLQLVKTLSESVINLLHVKGVLFSPIISHPRAMPLGNAPVPPGGWAPVLPPPIASRGS